MLLKEIHASYKLCSIAIIGDCEQRLCYIIFDSIKRARFLFTTHLYIKYPTSQLKLFGPNNSNLISSGGGYKF